MTLHHYTGCGLPNVFLENGFERKKTPFGDGVVIHDVEGLHRAIGKLLVEKQPCLTGAEFRFLRVELDMSQRRIGELGGVEDQTVALWEKNNKVPRWADLFVRVLYSQYYGGNPILVEMVDRLNQMDREAHRDKLTFEDTEEGWISKAA